MADQQKSSGKRLAHLTDLQHLKHRRNRKVIRGDQPDIRDCKELNIDTMKNYSPSQRSKKSPRGYVRFEDGKYSCQERGTVDSTLPYTFEYTFENLAAYRKWHAITAIAEWRKSASEQELTVISEWVADLLPRDFLMIPLNLLSIGQFVEFLSHLSLRQMEDLDDLLRLTN